MRPSAGQVRPGLRACSCTTEIRNTAATSAHVSLRLLPPIQHPASNRSSGSRRRCCKGAGVTHSGTQSWAGRVGGGFRGCQAREPAAMGESEAQWMPGETAARPGLTRVMVKKVSQKPLPRTCLHRPNPGEGDKQRCFTVLSHSQAGARASSGRAGYTSPLLLVGEGGTATSNVWGCGVPRAYRARRWA